jgi:hypothetical protein
MARANNANTRIAFVPEVTPGVTPATPAFVITRALSESFVVERELVFSGELDGRRGEKNHAISRNSGSGGFEFEYTDGTFESLFESTLRGAWAADVLVDGNTPKSFTAEVMFETGTPDIFKRALGAEVNTLALALNAGQKITGSFGLLARSSVYANAAIAGATYAAPGTDPVLVGADFSNLALDALTVGCVSALTFNLNNNLQREECLGTLAATGMAAGSLEATGTLAVYLSEEEFDILDAYQTGVATGLDFRIGRTAGSILRVELPEIVLSDMQVVSESKDGSVMMNMNWRALQASSLSGAVIRMTRNI